MISFKGRHFSKDIILMAVRWYVAYPLSYRNIEELMAERNIKLDHSAVQKWVVHNIRTRLCTRIVVEWGHPFFRGIRTRKNSIK